jgi:hypothetical protein
LKILKFFNKKYHNPNIFENQCPTIFGNSWSMNFSKFMVHEFFGIHSPRFFGIQCPTIFCDFGLFNSLAQAGGGGPYYMIFHYQKHTVLNYSHTWVGIDLTYPTHSHLGGNRFDCAAGFALLNLPKGKSLGRSKPETNSSNEQAH